MSYVLYYAPGACSLASHIILRETGTPFELIKVSTKTHKMEDGSDFYAVNPKGYVPALKLETGEILTEGPAVMQYIADLHPDSGLLPKAGSLARARVQEWLTFIGTELHKTFGPLFHAGTSDDQKAAAKETIKTRLPLVEQALGDGRSYLTGESFTVADAYLFVVVSWTNHVGIDLAPWPKLQAFQTRVRQRPQTQAAMKAEGLA